jgi:hypothetical protein
VFPAEKKTTISKLLLTYVQKADRATQEPSPGRHRGGNSTPLTKG